MLRPCFIAIQCLYLLAWWDLHMFLRGVYQWLLIAAAAAAAAASCPCSVPLLVPELSAQLHVNIWRMLPRGSSALVNVAGAGRGGGGVRAHALQAQVHTAVDGDCHCCFAASLRIDLPARVVLRKQ